MKNQWCVLALVASCGCALAQDFNIDFDMAGTVAETPPLDFFAGAGLAGRWNGVPASSLGPVALVDRTGAATPAFFTRSGGGGAFTFDNFNSQGEAHYLLDDIIDIGPLDSIATLRIDGVVPGLYEIITYAVAPDDAAARTEIFVPGSTSVNPQVVGGEIPQGAFIPGVTHASHIAMVDADGILALQASTVAGFGSVNGLQVRLIAPARVHVDAYAAPGGDGTSWTKALSSLQAAIELAQANPAAVREIWVTRNGAHFPSSPGGRDSAFRFTTSANVFGGFAGTETSLAERDLSGGVTLLSGAGAGGGGLNTDWVVRFSPAGGRFDGMPACLDGFGIIRGGNGDGTDGGGIRISGGFMRRCTVAYCTGTDGGGIRLSDFGAVNDTIVHTNQAVRGGGIHVSGNNAFVGSCTFAGNTASGNGGGIYLTGFTSIQSTLIYGNQAFAGGGVAGAGVTVAPALTGCTVADNTASIYGGLYIVDTDGAPGGPSLRDSIVWNNTDADGGTDAFEANLKYSAWPFGIGMSRCIVQGFVGGAPFEYTIDADPLFTAPYVAGGPVMLDENYEPLAGSPAIDAGDTDRVRFDEFDLDRDGDRVELIPFDARRHPRVQDDPSAPDTGAGGPPVVDIGAIERAFVPLCPADFNQDGGVDGADVAAFFGAWENGLTEADTNQDGGIDGGDVDTFFVAWEAGGC
jgi:parallel beta-helix repeat protein